MGNASRNFSDSMLALFTLVASASIVQAQIRGELTTSDTALSAH
jgi:hypothetical protein